MNPLKDRNFNPDSMAGEYNLMEMWTNLRAERFIAGAKAGVFAGVVAQLYGMIFCTIKGLDPTISMRFMALPMFGNKVMQFGDSFGIIAGLITYFALAIFLGVAYAYFTGVNHKKALFPMGLTWGVYGWIFITCLFMPANRNYFAADIPRGVMFFGWLVYGVSLMSVAMFDKNNPYQKKR